MDKHYAIKTPRLFIYFILITLQLIILYLFNFGLKSIITISLQSLMVICQVVLISAILYRLSLKPKTIHLLNDSIKIYNKEVSISSIDKIILQGYFVQTIGIKPHHKKLIPSYLVFRFKENEEKHIKELREWAVQNNVEVKEGNIQSWF